MLQPPLLPVEELLACLHDEFGVQGADLAFLPWGADPDTAVFRLVSADGSVYFVKLRSGVFDDVTVALPHLLHCQGNEHVIAPLATRAGELHGRCAAYAVMLSPYVEGRNGFEAELTPAQWGVLGRALRGLHSMGAPQALAARAGGGDFRRRLAPAGAWGAGPGGGRNDRGLALAGD